MTKTPIISLLLIVCGLFYACAPDTAAGGLRAALDQEILTTTVDRGIVFYGIGDTLAFREWTQAADSVTQNANQYTFHFGEDQYQALEDRNTGQLRSPFPLPHFERMWDTVGRAVNMIRMLDNHRVKAEIRAADFSVGRDSFRLGVIRVLGSAFGLRADTIDYPDYLIVTTYGNNNFPIVMDQDNVGAISRQTVFRVGRNHYALKSIGTDYGEIEIEALPDARGVQLAAELETTFKSVPVVDADGRKVSIKREKGKELFLYFWGLGSRKGEDVRLLQEAYQSLPAAEKDKLQIVLVNVNNTPADVAAFLTTANIDLPSYRTTGKTCLRLNCHPSLPYYVNVSAQGRIVSYYKRHEELMERFQSLLAEPRAAGR